jgi:hypothetical protein
MLPASYVCNYGILSIPANNTATLSVSSFSIYTYGSVNDAPTAVDYDYNLATISPEPIFTERNVTVCVTSSNSGWVTTNISPKYATVNWNRLDVSGTAILVSTAVPLYFYWQSTGAVTLEITMNATVSLDVIVGQGQTWQRNSTYAQKLTNTTSTTNLVGAAGLNFMRVMPDQTACVDGCDFYVTVRSTGQTNTLPTFIIVLIILAIVLPIALVVIISTIVTILCCCGVIAVPVALAKSVNRGDTSDVTSRYYRLEQPE